MARRRKNDGTRELGIVLTIIFVGGFFLIKWSIEALIWFFQLVAKLFVSISDYFEKKKKEKDNIKKSEQEILKKHEQVNHNTINNKLVESKNCMQVPSINNNIQNNEFDMNIYDNLFESQIRRRGLIYYKQNRVNNLKNTDNRFTCNVSGSEDYKVSITFDKINKDKIVRTKCTCPYFQDGNNKCKHIYAALLQIKNNKPIEAPASKNIESQSIVNNSTSLNNSNNSRAYLFKSILNKCDEIENKINEVRERYEELDFENDDVDYVFSQIEDYEVTIDEYRNKKIVELNEDLYNELESDYDDFINLCDEFESNIDDAEAEIEELEQEAEDEEEASILAGAILYEMHKKHQEDLEEEERLEAREKLKYEWGLTDYQADLVESGEYEPCQFGEEELEEDDYYYEDDRD